MTREQFREAVALEMQRTIEEACQAEADPRVLAHKLLVQLGKLHPAAQALDQRPHRCG